MTIVTIDRLASLFGKVAKPCRERLFEWLATGMMLGAGVLLLLWPESIVHGSYRYLVALGFTGWTLGSLFLIFGMPRLAALLANGLWPQAGPMCRVFGALGGAGMWAQMFIALATYTWKSGPSMALAVYFFLMIGEIVSCWRAASDVVRTHHGG